ncbi:putative oxygenase (putative secreted protein) [Rhodococcus wratislaviensis]|uniref:Putative oxygenase (Putative secreted protein) n=1 Tax=Rhodococcus wratislaviensis TaxID=44752 RepID=A0A402C2Q2_RHOWR|nr:TauD/TfdA family dioxygenase [Rhodococcus wratislaviensis]GCE37860.1 putative oxygenase (putative secreted protein) [Rhodococcus wratislaviensis]
MSAHEIRAEAAGHDNNPVAHPTAGASQLAIAAATGLTWQEHRLSERERSMIEERALTTTADPYRDPIAFRTATKHAWTLLDAPTRRAVRDVGRGTSARPELYIVNLPEPQDLPPTPTQSGTWERTTDNVFSEFIMVMFSHGLGLPISYRDQRNGTVFHDIFPTAANAMQISSQSSGIILGHHTEMFFHPCPPDHLMLHCLRSDPDRLAQTFVAALPDIESRLPATTREILRAPSFALDLAELHGSYVHRGRPICTGDPRPVIPIVTDSSPVQFRFEPALTTPVGRAAADALHAAEHAAHEAAVAGTLDAGGLLILDNRRAAHARSSFPARFDGTDRWLRRMMLGRFGRAEDIAVIRSHDLELVKPWIDLGVALETIPYRNATKDEQ